MKSHTQISTILLILILTLNACAPQATAIPATETPQPAPTATLLPPTATPLPPLLMVGGDVPCYAGPGPDYESLATLVIGMQVEVLSKDSTGEYWIVQSPAGNGQCWTESRYATIVGSSDRIPVLAVDAVPTRSLKPPESPRKIITDMACTAVRVLTGTYGKEATGEMNIYIKLSWPKTKGETGYRIYKNGNLIVELVADTEEYIDQFTIKKGGVTEYTYIVEAFNKDGASQSPETRVIVDYHRCK